VDRLDYRIGTGMPVDWVIYESHQLNRRLYKIDMQNEAAISGLNKNYLLGTVH